MDDMNAIEFDVSGWTRSPDQDDTSRVWTNADLDRVSLMLAPHLEPSRFDLDDPSSCRRFVRRRAAGGGSDLIEADVIELAGVHSLRAIFKRTLLPTGFAYAGEYSFRVGEAAYTITFQSHETGDLGVQPSNPSLGRLRRNMQGFEETLGIKGADQERGESVNRAAERSGANVIFEHLEKATGSDVFMVLKSGKNTMTKLDIADDFRSTITSLGGGHYLEKDYSSLDEAIRDCAALVKKNAADVYYVMEDDTILETVMDSDFHETESRRRERRTRFVGALVVSLISAVVLFAGVPPRTAMLSLCVLVILHLLLSYLLDFELFVAAIPPIVFATLLSVAL